MQADASNFEANLKAPKKISENPIIKVGKRLYENPHFEVSEVEADFGAFTKTYLAADYGERSGVVVHRELPETGIVEVLLVRQWRLLIRGHSLEIPGGKVDPGESAEESAQRECFEESGVRCLRLTPLLAYEQGMDIVKTGTFLFSSNNFVEDREFVPDEREVNSVHWIPLKECVRMIFDGKIVDGFTILALLVFKIQLDQND